MTLSTDGRTSVENRLRGNGVGNDGKQHALYPVLEAPLMDMPDRVAQIEISAARLAAIIEAGFQENRDSHATIKALVDDIQGRIVGNGHPGIQREIEILRQRQNMVIRSLIVVGGAVGALLLDFVARFLQGRPMP